MALEPVAVEIHDPDLPQRVGHDEKVPRRQQWRRLRPHVRPDQPSHLPHRVALDAYAVLERIVLRLQWSFNALSGWIEHPSVVAAPQPAHVRNTVPHLRHPMWAPVSYQSHLSVRRPEQHQVLAQDADGHHLLFQQLRRGPDRNPVPSHQFAHRRSRPHSRQALILLGGQHRISPRFLEARDRQYTPPFRCHWTILATQPSHGDDTVMTTSRPPLNDTLDAFCTDTEAFLEGDPSGPLSGLTFAAKDIFDVAGHVTGGGNPDWKATHQPAEHTAWVIQTLVDAGATMVGKTHTDELTRGILGENAHYGTPVNPRAPGRVPGGSSSGSAAAVAGGLVDFALGSDTGGSVRIPAQLLRTVRPAPHSRANSSRRHPAPGPQLRHHRLVRPRRGDFCTSRRSHFRQRHSSSNPGQGGYRRGPLRRMRTRPWLRPCVRSRNESPPWPPRPKRCVLHPTEWTGGHGSRTRCNPSRRGSQ